MNEQVALWDIDETLTDYKAIKSTDWKWNMATDYPEKTGLLHSRALRAVAVAQWDINYVGLTFSVVAK